MEGYARFIVQRPIAWAVVVATLVAVLVAAMFAGKVRQEDDILAFLPAKSPEIVEFHAINDKFGGLDVALVGVETDDVFAPEFLERLRDATKKLKETPGVDRVLTLANVPDFVEDPIAGGVRITDLVDRIPQDDAARAALRAKVLSRDHVAGTLVSKDGQAVVLYCFLAWGDEPRVVAERVQAVAQAAFPDETLYWGGAPFISTWIYGTTQDDLRRLVPWAVLVIVIITIASFRDVVGAFVGLFATMVGIVVSRGTMGFLGVPDNLVLASMPVILFAVGSAYAIHVLTRFYALHHEGNTVEDAVVGSLTSTAPAVLAAAGTTIAGLLSFTVMDIEPMRTFGAFSALGVAVAMVVALTFVPAVIVLRRPARPPDPMGVVDAWTANAVERVMRHRLPIGVVVATLLVAAAVFSTRVDNRMDDAAFFTKGSPPAQATEFLDAHFGGSRFIQVHVQGDLSDPTVLREVQRVSDRLADVAGVVDVQSAPRVVALVNQSMTGARRVPDTREQAGVLYGFLAGDPSVDQLITRDRRDGLLIVRLSAPDIDAVERVQEGVDAVIADAHTTYDVTTGPEALRWLHETVALRIQRISVQFATVVPDRDVLVSRFEGERPPADPRAVADDLVQFLVSEENFAPVPEEAAGALGVAVSALGPDPDEALLRDTIAAALGPDADPMLADDLVLALAGPLPDAWRRARAEAFTHQLVADSVLSAPAGYEEAVSQALLDLDVEQGMVALPQGPPDAPQLALHWSVSGQPVLYEAMSRSVSWNQVKALWLALVPVFLILWATLRSVTGALLASTPMISSVLFVSGLMGLLGVHLDIGTSMIASLVIGEGADYALSMLLSWRDPTGKDDPIRAAREASGHTATAIWTNALTVAAGFFVLTLGDAKPLRTVGAITASAMLFAALTTYVVIPLLARRARYGR